MKRIPLTQGKHALVDSADFAWLSRWRWYALRNRHVWYAARRRRTEDGPGPPSIQMHRVVVGAPSHLEVDHINGNGLDNRRQNLRLATSALNKRNYHRRNERVPYLPMGVYADRRRFQARVTRAGRMIYLGTFDTPDAAHAAYLAAREQGIAEEVAIVRRFVEERK